MINTNTQSERRELLRLTVLLAAESAAPYGVGVDVLLVGCQMRGLRDVERAGLLAEVGYLVDKGFIAEVEKALSPERRLWRITAAGRDFLAMEGHQ